MKVEHTTPAKYCRICFKHSQNRQDPMLPLRTFIPLIKLIAQTDILHEGESNICQSCSNVLVMANLFRIKIIESNGVFRELIDSKKAVPDDKEEFNFLDGLDLENFTSQPFIVGERMELDDCVDYECLDEGVEDLPEVQPPIKDKPPIKTLDRPNRTNQKVSKVGKITKAYKKECFVCGEKEPKEQLSQEKLKILRKILHISIDDSVAVCAKCQQSLKRVEKFVEQNFTVTNVEKESKCQFCLKSSIRLVTTAKYLFKMYNLLADAKNQMPESAKVEKKTCNECLKALQVMHEIQNTHKIKRRIERRHAQSIQVLFKDKFNVGVRKNGSYRGPSRKLKRRVMQKYVKPDPNEEVPDDYQCHMSDFEEVESDTDMPPVTFGSPLNTPFSFDYLECTECHAKCITPLQLEVHIEAMHRTFNNICNLCGKTFPNIACVRNHKHNVHFVHCSYSINGSNGNKLLCDICGLLTRTFDIHYNIHMDVKNYVCDLCGHATRVKDKLKLHIFAKHMNFRKYKCKYCGKGFNYTPDRMRHEIASHTKQYKYICSICDRGFLKKNFLTAHQKSHDIKRLEFKY